MSTSTKGLKVYEIIFKRPAIAAGFLLIVAAIVVKPLYNFVPVFVSIALYFILYQNRRYIYKLGLGRFDFLAFLFYIPFFFSLFINWAYSYDGNDGVVSAIMTIIGGIANTNILYFAMDAGYRAGKINLLIENLDSIFHWKMAVFSLSFAVILYLIFVEFDRKSVKETDLQSLGLTDGDLYRHGNITAVLGMAFFVVASFFYGFQYAIYAGVFIATMMWFRLNLFVIFAAISSALILVLNFTSFNYIVFLSLPNKFMHVVIRHGIWDATKMFANLGQDANIGQWYILLPYIIIMGLASWVYLRNLGKVREVTQTKAQAYEIANTVDAVDFGYDMSSRKPIRITHKELNTHMYLNGASGSGKTVAMLNLVIEAAQKGIPLVYIDGKGATDLAVNIAKIARDNKRVFKVFTLSPDSLPHVSCYDFLGAGTFTEKKNRVMQLFIQADVAGAAYYQDSLETFINRVFLVIHNEKLRIDLARFLDLINNINHLIEMASRDIILGDGLKVNLKSYFEEIRDMKPEQSPRTRIITKLDPFIHSSYGHLFSITNKPDIINIKQSILNGEIVLFLFDSSAFSLDTERVAKMVISDLNATFAEFGKEGKPIKTFCCFDEFKSYQTDAISKTISLHRSNGMHAIIGTQSLALIDREIGNGILTNCQTHLVMASADADAMRFSEEFGKAQTVEFTTRINAEEQQVSDIITKSIKDYQIDKQDIKNIMVGTGQGYLHRKAIGAKAVKIQVTQKV